MDPWPCPVARGVKRALEDAEQAYAGQRIVVDLHLTPDSGLRTTDELVYRAVYTIFRGLPARLAPGTSLHIATESRAGGDVELVWEGTEDLDRVSHPMGLTPTEALTQGPYGDLFEVALFALESLCRARGGLVELPLPPESSGPERAPIVRRYMFLVPSQDRSTFEPRRA